MLWNSIGHVLIEATYATPKLHGNASDKLASIPHISATSSKKKACSKLILVIKLTSNRAGDHRLFCASPSAKPKYSALILSIKPCEYLMNKIDTCI